MDNNEVKIINEEDKTYYKHFYYVCIPTGTAFMLSYKVYADYEQQALEIVTAFMECNGGCLYTINEVDEEEEFFEVVYLYVDATEYGASQPYYLIQPYNISIEEI